MSDDRKSIYQSLIDWVDALGVDLRAAVNSPILVDADLAEAKNYVDPAFEGWLHNDPMVTGNRANRYGKGARGYMTSNGRGSLEIGAADD